MIIFMTTIQLQLQHSQHEIDLVLKSVIQSPYVCNYKYVNIVGGVENNCK